MLPRTPNDEVLYHPDTDETGDNLFPTSNPEGYQLPSDRILPEGGPNSKSAIVIGAGIVGVTTAYELAKKGYDVTVIDKYNMPASYCSHANAGVIHRNTHSLSLFSEFLKWNTFKSLLWNTTPDSTSKVFIDRRFFMERNSYRFMKCYFKLFANKMFFKYIYFGRKKYETNLLKSHEIFNDYCIKSFEENLQTYENDYGFKERKYEGNLLNIKPSENNSYQHLKDNFSMNDETQFQSLISNAYAVNCALFTYYFSKLCAQKFNVKFRFNTELNSIFVFSFILLNI